MDNTTGENRPGLWERIAAEFTPPEPWNTRPASLAELCRYAQRGAWTSTHGPARNLGKAWFWCFTLPASTVTHYTAWVIARPSRTVTVVVVWGLLMHVPALRAVAGFLLPFDPWPTWAP